MKTKRILTNQAVPGMVVAEDIYTFNNQLIIGKNATLTNRTITRLKFYSIYDIRIILDEGGSESESTGENTTIFFPPTKSFLQDVRSSEEFIKFNSKFVTTVDNLKSTFAQIAENPSEPIAVEKMLAETNKILKECRNGVHLFHILESMRDYDDLTYAHSLSVSLICGAMGHWFGFNDDDIATLTLSGLLHDIGKMAMPQELITKPGPLSAAEYKIIQSHPQKGFELIKQQNLDQRVKNTVLMHHERCNGNGYPHRLTTSKIDTFAKIVSIADTYEAMTAARVYREAICPFEVIRVFETEGLVEYDPHYLLSFLEHMVETYVQSRVHLSNGLEGEVIMINKFDLSRPIVKIQNLYIDLSKRKHLTITSVL